MSDTDDLMAAARRAAENAYAPYSEFHVGAALRFDDGEVVTGANVENASYGLSLCAEAVALGKAFAEGRRNGFVEVAVFGAPKSGTGLSPGPDIVTPCGRCRQMLNEMASVSGTDPMVHCVKGEGHVSFALSALLPLAFGPENLSSGD